MAQKRVQLSKIQTEPISILGVFESKDSQKLKQAGLKQIGLAPIGIELLKERHSSDFMER